MVFIVLNCSNYGRSIKILIEKNGNDLTYHATPHIMPCPCSLSMPGKHAYLHDRDQMVGRRITIGLVSGLETKDIHIHRDLVERSKRGDSKAQYELYGLYVDAMFNIGMRMLHGREDAEDVIQDSFIDAFRNLEGYRYESTFGSWLKRIVINKCINQINKKRVDTTPLDSHDYRLHVEEDEEVVTDHQYEIKKVKAGIAQLTAGYRQIITLYLVEGYDHREISAILNISEGTSKSQYHRAKKKLLEILKSA